MIIVPVGRWVGEPVVKWSVVGWSVVGGWVVGEFNKTLQLSKSSMKPQKTTGQPKDPWLATRAPHSHSTTPQADGQN